MRRAMVTITAAAVAVAAGVSLKVLVHSGPGPEWAQGSPGPRPAGSTVITVDSQVLFGVDSDELHDTAEPALRKIAVEIGRSPGRGHVRVEGHTDTDGSEDYNHYLSQNRADRVARWLTTKAGVDPARIQTFAYGETFPVTDNDTPAHRELNRCVIVAIEP